MCATLVHFFFFFNDTATTEIYTLSLHDALPIYLRRAAPHRVDVRRRAVRHVPALGGQPRPPPRRRGGQRRRRRQRPHRRPAEDLDRKSTRLNSSHANISYAVFCLKKKKKE